MKRKAAVASYTLKVRSTAAATPTDVLHGDDSSGSDSSSCSAVPSDLEAGPSTQKIQRLTSIMRGEAQWRL